MKPTMNVHTNQQIYKTTFALKSQIPANALYYISKIVGPKKAREGAKEFLTYVNKCGEIGSDFAYFMNNEWIFDNSTVL